MAALSRDIEINWRGYALRAKAGTRLEHVPFNAGLKTPGYAIPPTACDLGDMQKYCTFELAHYYVWAPSDAIAE